MSHTVTALYVSLFLLACTVLSFTSYTDLKRRMINSFIFIPVVALGAAFNIMNGAPLFFVVLGVLIFLATYLETDLVIYPVIGVIFMAVSLYFIVSGSILYGFTSVIMSMMYLIGFQEKLFGIGDVKAMIALFFSFTEFPFHTPLTALQSNLPNIMPLSLVMLFNIAIISMIYIPYLFALNRARGSSIGLHSFTSVEYDEGVYNRNKAKFSIRTTPSGKKIMVYKTPFMVPVSLGFIVTMLAGFWFLLL